MPGNGFFLAMVIVMTFSALLFLAALNQVLQRLGAMLPDEALRLDIKQFTVVNLNLLVLIFLLGAASLTLGLSHNQPLYRQVGNLPLYLQNLIAGVEDGGSWLPLVLGLLPLAMTMALLWKTKEVILDNVFSGKTG
jgi:hypothetical protein